MPLLNSLYVGVLLLIMVIDLRQRRILNWLALPATLFALAAGLWSGPQVFWLTALGALTGFAFFYGLSWLGQRLYGTAALGFGDVKLALLLGAMLGLHYVMPALALGMLLAGLGAVFLLLTKRSTRRSTLPYGAFMAAAGILVLAYTSF